MRALLRIKWHKLGRTAALVAGAISLGLAAPETETVYLSGHGADDPVTWDFFCTAGRNSGVWSKIRVPSCWEQEGFGTYQYGIELRSKKNAPPLANEVGKYRLDFPAPVKWRGRTVRLVFAGAMTDTEVWINGQPVGPRHQGAFYEFKYDVTSLLHLGGSNRLEVTVSKESADPSVNEAERRADYWNFGGIFRPVFLEVLPPAFIDRTAIDARADGGFRAEVFLGTAAAAPGRIVARILDGSGAEAAPPVIAAFAAGATSASLTARIASPRLWTAETPVLYRANFTLEDGDRESHGVSERFGFRTFEVRERDGLYLNGRKITLKGVNRHSFWPESARTLSRRLNFDDARLIRAMNMNAVRMSHYPPDRDFLEACDELGLYVLDELGGWHGHYETPVGQKLVGEMVRRDVNHPCILFWDNGNEGGWNTALDAEFAKWDPQPRPVLHPQQKLSGVETMHYRSYAETQDYLGRGDIYLPTEFLHGLYDGGHGAGLWDYWELMRKTPNCAGGFLWVFADEGVSRTDQQGRIDNVGNYAADGIVGPHHEPEGSFETIREVWSPVQAGPARLPADFQGTLAVENRYDFTNLDQCTFSWSLGRFSRPDGTTAGHANVASGELKGPSVPAGAAGELRLPLPADWRSAEVLYVTARDPGGRPLWTWSWNCNASTARAGAAAIIAIGGEVTSHESATELRVNANGLHYRFNKLSGELAGVDRGGQRVSFGQGPRLYAVRRGDRLPDGTVQPKVEKGVDRRYESVAEPGRLVSFVHRAEGASIVVEATYAGSLRKTRWLISPSGEVQLDYEYAFDGVVDMAGINFEYPESAMKSVRWLGRGPYRAWQNRTHGGVLDVWQKDYNDPLPGETFAYPEFKGYFRDWQWASFGTSEGAFTVTNGTPGSFLGIYTPRDGRDGLLYTFPQSGIAILDVIPPVRNKVNATDLIGPQSQPVKLQGARRGSVRFEFDPKRP